jgi:hypothetical protein
VDLDLEDSEDKQESDLMNEILKEYDDEEEYDDVLYSQDDDEMPIENESPMDESPMEDEMPIENVSPTTTPVNDIVTNEARKFDREETDRYFERELQVGKGAGGRGIVADSFFRSLGIDKLDLSEDDIEICLQMSMLVSSLSIRQDTMLARFLSLLLASRTSYLRRKIKYGKSGRLSGHVRIAVAKTV